MTDATAKYIITAEDRTKTAIASVKEGFKTLDHSIRDTTKSLNLMAELFIGGRLLGGVKRLTDSIIKAASETDKGFGDAMDHVKTAFENLLAPKGGLPEATESMKELAATLSNPATLAAADSLASSLIRGFAGSAKYVGEIVAGMGLILHGSPKESGKIDDKSSQLMTERQAIIESMGGRQNLHFSEVFTKRVAEIDAQLVALNAKYFEALDKETKADKDAAAAAEALAKAKQHMFDVKAANIRLLYAFKKESEEVDAAGKFLEQFDAADKAAEKLTRTSVENQIQAWNDYFASLNLLRAHDLIDQGEYNKRARDYIDNTLQEFQVTVHQVVPEHKKAVDTMAEYAKQAAHSIQTSFANFLFDPFHAGLKGMLTDFLNVIRRMIAETAASKILGKDGGGLSGWLGAIVGGIFGGGGGDGGAPAAMPAGGYGFATGGSFTVGGSGGTDSQAVRFRATPGERVTIRRPGDDQGDGQGAVTVNYNVDARGATTDLVAALPAILRQHADAVKTDIVEGLRRRKYAI